MNSLINKHRGNEVAFADDFTVAGKTSKTKAYWNILQEQGPFFGYVPKTSKSYLIMKEQHYNEAVEVLMRRKLKVTSEEKRHFGAIIGSEAFKVWFAKSLVDDWIKQLKLLSIIVESQPQCAYSAFVGGFKGRLTIFCAQYHS